MWMPRLSTASLSLCYTLFARVVLIQTLGKITERAHMCFFVLRAAANTHPSFSGHIREKYAQLEQTWSSLSDIYARGEAVLADPRAEGIHRTLNGAIMLGRNLVSVAKAGTLAWDSGASTQVISIIQTLLELKDQSPGGKCNFCFTSLYLYSPLHLNSL